MKPMKQRSRFNVPIYDVDVIIVVTRDIPREHRREFDSEIEDTHIACVGYSGRKFALFLEPAALARPEIIAHEIFHLTHRILELCEANFDSTHHEQGAYLCEYLHKMVARKLRN